MQWMVMAKWIGILGLIAAIGFWQRHDGAVSERVVWETRLAEENANAVKETAGYKRWVLSAGF